MSSGPYPAGDPRGYGVLILAGGEATRLPGKLELDAGGVPMIVRVARNFAGAATDAPREIVLSCKATFPGAVDALLPFPAVVDRWPRRGPLAGMLTCLPRFSARFVVAIAGDAPLLDGRFADGLAARWEPGDEAVVPVRRDGDGEIVEPLAALYDRLAFVRAGLPLLRAHRGALSAVLARLRTRLVPYASEPFANVNTPRDYEKFIG